MKFFYIIFIIFFAFSINIYSNEIEILECDSKPLSEIMNILHSKYNIDILFNPSTIMRNNTELLLTIKVKNISLINLIKSIELACELKFIEIDKNFFIIKRKQNTSKINFGDSIDTTNIQNEIESIISNYSLNFNNLQKNENTNNLKKNLKTTDSMTIIGKNDGNNEIYKINIKPVNKENLDDYKDLLNHIKKKEYLSHEDYLKFFDDETIVYPKLSKIFLEKVYASLSTISNPKIEDINIIRSFLYDYQKDKINSRKNLK